MVKETNSAGSPEDIERKTVQIIEYSGINTRRQDVRSAELSNLDFAYMMSAGETSVRVE